MEAGVRVQGHSQAPPCGSCKGHKHLSMHFITWQRDHYRLLFNTECKGPAEVCVGVLRITFLQSAGQVLSRKSLNYLLILFFQPGTFSVPFTRERVEGVPRVPILWE